MGIQLNIKDEATVRLARQLADATGGSMTSAIKNALERELYHLAQEREARVARIDKILEEVWRNPPPAWEGKTSKEIMDELYDDNGLPV